MIVEADSWPIGRSLNVLSPASMVSGKPLLVETVRPSQKLESLEQQTDIFWPYPCGCLWCLRLEINGLVFGKIYFGKPLIFSGKIDGFRCRFSLKPIHWGNGWILNAFQLITGPSAHCGLQWFVLKEPAGRHCGEAHHAGAMARRDGVAVTRWHPPSRWVRCGAMRCPGVGQHVALIARLTPRTSLRPWGANHKWNRME